MKKKIQRIRELIFMEVCHILDFQTRKKYFEITSTIGLSGHIDAIPEKSSELGLQKFLVKEITL